MNLSIISYYGIQASRCGYCKGTKCSKSHGMHAYTMTTQDYQSLIDRGWRRSGQYCYKPNNSTTCCPSYTIKCDAHEFKLSKSHKKILKRMNRFLRDGKKDKNEETTVKADASDAAVEMDVGGQQDEPKAPDVPLPQIDLEAVKVADNKKCHSKKLKENVADSIIADVVDGAVSTSLNKQPCDTQNPPRKKAKQLRLERRQAKLLAKGIDIEMTTSTKPATQANQEKSLADFLAETTTTDKHTLKIVLVPSSTLKVDQETFNLYCKYQITIHNDPPERLTKDRLKRFLYESPLKLRLVNVLSDEFQKTLSTSYKLYEKYQTSVHMDPPDGVEDYLTFLGISPLKYDVSSDGPPEGYGSFHQQYWLDNKLIAVGVIDILPYCLSSVYFFYDPDYSFLSLGTYASLREIEFVQQLSRHVPDLKYYYMGFYIHSCPKMRYKGKLVPSYLLCSEAYTWHLLNDAIKDRLDASKYQRFNNDPNAKDKDEFKESDLNDVLLLVKKNICMTYEQYMEITGNVEDEEERNMILEYGKFVGKTCAHRMVYVSI